MTPRGCRVRRRRPERGSRRPRAPCSRDATDERRAAARAPRSARRMPRCGCPRSTDSRRATGWGCRAAARAMQARCRWPPKQSRARPRAFRSAREPAHVAVEPRHGDHAFDSIAARPARRRRCCRDRFGEQHRILRRTRPLRDAGSKLRTSTPSSGGARRGLHARDHREQRALARSGMATSATVAPAITRTSRRGALGAAGMVKWSRNSGSPRRGPERSRRAALDLRVRVERLDDAVERGAAALEQVDHPAQRIRAS